MSPKVGMGPVRREQIVRATIRCLAREGYTAADHEEGGARGRREPGHSALLLRRQAGHPRPPRSRWSPAISIVGWPPPSRAPAAIRAARLRALVRACLEVAVQRPGVLGGVRRVLGRDAARSAPARSQRRGLHAHASPDRPPRRRGRAGRPLPRRSIPRGPPPWCSASSTASRFSSRSTPKHSASPRPRASATTRSERYLGREATP